MKRILYFGTMPGRAGHWPYAYSTFSPVAMSQSQANILMMFLSGLSEGEPLIIKEGEKYEKRRD